MSGKPIHGLSRTPVYCMWQNIVARCCRPTFPTYKYYGGRGIRICNQWRHDPAAFCKWAVKNGYKKGLQIDRIDNNKGYSPTNCRFVVPAVNLRNTSRNRRLSLNGETKTISEWSRDLGLTESCLIKRKDSGWDDESALTAPVNKHLQRFSPPAVVVFRGEKRTISEWAKISGLNPGTINTRLKNGWPPERALTTPANPKMARPGKRRKR